MLPSAARSRQIATRTRNELSAIYNEIEDSEIKEYVDRIVNGMDTERLEDFQANYISYFYKIKQKIDSLLVDYRIEYFNKQLDWDVIKAKKIFKLQPTMVMPKKTNKYTKTLYEYELDDMNSFEEYAIESIIALENVKWWHRNGNRDSSDSYFINGYLNHYPDFIVGTEKGKVLFIETKGEHLANDDTELKLKLGEKLEAKAGNNFKYYMIFKDEAKFDMSFNLQDALEDIRHQ
jgi:type III restriction enzyme